MVIVQFDASKIVFKEIITFIQHGHIKFKVNTFIIQQKVSISNKCCLKFYSIYQTILEKKAAKLFPT